MAKIELATTEQRLHAGKRDRCTRASHGKVVLGQGGKRDVVALIKDSNDGRLESLVPIRHGRMLQRAFAYFRGAAAVGALSGAMLLLGTPMPVNAQSAGGSSGDWRYEFTPYLWASGMKGDVQGGNLPRTSVDMSFTDILDILDFGIMGAFEARKGRWGLLFDSIYMKVSDSATASRTGPGPIGATATANADATMKQTMLAAAVAYRVVEGRSPVDAIGGLRYSKIDVSATIDASLFGLTGSAARSGDKDWVDPYVGVRIQHPLNDRWTLVGYGDIGGFSAGSDFTWQVALGAAYDFSKTMSGKFGYRYLSVDYDKGGFLYDMKTQGVYLGLGIRF